jgi:hypothetical protein
MNTLKFTASVLAAASALTLTGCGSSQTPLQKCDAAIKTAIDNGAQLTTGAEPAAVKSACGSLPASAKAKAAAYAETYFAQKHP